MSAGEGIRERARRAGIALDYEDVWGRRHAVPESSLPRLLDALSGMDESRGPCPPIIVVTEGEDVRVPLAGERPDGLAWEVIEAGGTHHTDLVPPGSEALVLPLRLPRGHHRLRLVAQGRPLRDTALIVTPERAHLPTALAAGDRVWGVAVQLYAIRSERNWGIGDFGDLREIVEIAARAGAHAIGLQPLHALFTANPRHDSPYSPSSRSHLNPLFIDVASMPEYAASEAARALVESEPFQRRLAELREADFVDYAGVWAAKDEVLRQVFRHFREAGDSSPRARAFAAFRETRGEALELFARFEALDARFRNETPALHGWRQWPEAYRDPHGQAVTAFAEAHAQEVAFHAFLQWIADEQLAEAARVARDAGMQVGLYLDLAVAADPGGADAWRDQALLALDLSVGAPPDELQLDGQNWGLPPYAPERLREARYAPFVAALQANMRHAGALRIDHVMGLYRLFVIPSGEGAAAGAYVHLPFDDLVRIVALESVRNECMVIGEDLGTVPNEVREAMSRTGILCYRPLVFAKRDDGGFLAPPEYPRDALVAVTTHDLPTLAGFWSAHDLALRTRLGLFDSDAVRERQVGARSQDLTRLLFALDREGLLPPDVRADAPQVPPMDDALAAAVHAFLARTPSTLMLVQAEDLLGVVEQTNLPGSVSPDHPNWQRKLPTALSGVTQASRAVSIVKAVSAARTPSARRDTPAGGAAVIVPRATYRVQLNKHFTFRDAQAIVPYLAALGISHLYASPFLKARPGSLHGYDIVDHGAINPEIGTEADLESLAAALHEHGMGLVADIVPNHMGAGSDNAWWLDVLENGQSAVHAPFFDIDWEPAKAELAGRVLLPLLGDSYGAVLERGELQLRFDPSAGAFCVRYYEHVFPVDPRSYPLVLGEAVRRLGAALGENDDAVVELESLSRVFGDLRRPDPADTDAVLAAHREREVHKRRLARMAQEAPRIARAIEEGVAALNGTRGDPSSYDGLHALLEAQHYRLADWHAASDEINYRRFFDVNELAALRMEDERVFEATHARILDLCARGIVDGLRIDHPDGLYDPQAYFERLQRRVAEVRGVAPTGRDVYLLVEKILAPHETLPDAWPVHGTTGYDFMNLVNGLFVDERAERPLIRLHESVTGEHRGFDEVLYESKRLVMNRALASELTVLANRINRISEADRHTRDYTLNRLRRALMEVAARFPVYRTYVREGEVHEGDRRHIDWAVGLARRHGADENPGIYDFVARALVQDLRSENDTVRFSMKFQQFTAPVTAKSMEDTALYRWLPLVSLNEVGGDPRRFGTSIELFHAANEVRARRWPHAMLATSTHDNKRGEDVRARIDALSELEGEWRRKVRAWQRLVRTRRVRIGEDDAPSHADEYLFFQTLVGFWPLDELDEASHATRVERLCAYMIKAAREAKVRTSWVAPHAAYEAALTTYIHRVLERSDRNLFLLDFSPFLRRVARIGAVTSLAQALLRITAPGVPDMYQGTEDWDDSLVDPDNRRPVEFGRLRELLGAARGDAPAPAGAPEAPGSAHKRFVTARALAVRRELEACYRDGSYVALAAEGPAARSVCAFARVLEGDAAITIVPRLAAGLAWSEAGPIGETAWSETRIALPLAAGATLVNRMTGERVSVHAGADGGRYLRLAEVFATFPCALLTAAREEPLGA